MAAVDDDMTGKVAVVTGATGGIGKEIARGLVRLGATVVIGARDDRRGAAAAGELGVTAYPLDVADQASIAAFAAAVIAAHASIDVLVNNAGAWFSDRRESPDGVELTFATNVLGPYLLTNALLAPLRAGHARVVNVVSSISGDYDADDLQFTRRTYDGFKAYAQSKQALRMITWGQAAAAEGTGMTANAVAPGLRPHRPQPQRERHADVADQHVRPAVRIVAGEGCRLPAMGGCRHRTRRRDRPIPGRAYRQGRRAARPRGDRRPGAPLRRDDR